MRTKVLLGLAALAVGGLTAMAQSNVYSLNVVGYYNVTVPAGKFGMIANQFNTADTKLATLIPSAPPNSIFYKYVTGSGYSLYTFDEFDLKWTPNGDATLNPGEGGLFFNAGTTPLTMTFVGEVPQGNLTNTVPTGYAVRSSIVPQAGKITTDLGLTGVPNEILYQYVAGSGYTLYTFDEFDLKWTPSEPTIGVGEAFLIFNPAGNNWVRNFTVQ